MEERTTSQSLSVLNFLFGVWLIISPYILNYATAQSKWEQTAAGALVAIIAVVRFAVPKAVWLSWVNALIGAWMVIAPFVTSYQSTTAKWNEVIFGILIIIVGLWNAATHPAPMSHSHGSQGAV